MIELYNNKKDFEVIKNENTDEEGFVYAFRFNFEFNKKMSKSSYVRKRILYFPKMLDIFSCLAKKEYAANYLHNNSNKNENTVCLENIFNPDSEQLPILVSEVLDHMENFALSVGNFFYFFFYF